MDYFKKILAAVDLSYGDRIIYPVLSEPAEEVLNKTLFAARSSGAAVTLQSAIDIDGGIPEFTKRTHDARPALEKEAMEVLGRCAEPFEKAGLEVERVVSIGKAPVEIIRLAIRGGHDLIVCGTRKTTLKHYTSLGSTSLKLVRKAPCPVWVAKPTREKNYRCVLAAVDLTPVSDKVVDLARNVADAYGAELHLLHVVEYPDLWIVYEEGAEKEVAEYKARVKEKSLEKLRALAEARPSPSGVRHLILKEGAPSREIIDAAEAMKPDVVVLATLSRTGIAGFITGNTAEKLLPEIKSSLLVVKPEGFESPIR